MSKNLPTLLLWGYLLAASLASAASTIDTPLSIYDRAHENDPEIRAAFASLQAEREAKYQSSGALKPSITLSGAVGAHREDVQTSGVGVSGESQFSSHNLQLILRQPLYRKDLFTELDITESAILAAEARYRAVQQNLISRVLESYFQSLAARDSLDYLLAEREAIEEQLVYTRKRYQVGKTTMTDFLEARAAFDLADAEVISARDRLSDSLDAIEEITGELPAALAPLAEDFSPVRPEPENVDRWIEIAEQNNPELLAAKYEWEKSKNQIRNSRADHYPKLDIVANYGTEETGGRFGDSEIDDAYVGLRLEFPLYSGGQTSSRVREAVNREDEARQILLDRRRAVVRETGKVYRNTLTAINRIRALEVAVQSTTTAIAAIRAGYNAGTRTNADLLRAQRELYKAKLDYAAARYQYAANYIQLKNITGSLTKNDIQLIDSWFRQ